MQEEELEEFVNKQVDEYEDRRLEYEEELKKLYVGKEINGKKVINVIVRVHSPKEDVLLLEDGSTYPVAKLMKLQKSDEK